VHRQPPIEGRLGMVQAPSRLPSQANAMSKLATAAPSRPSAGSPAHRSGGRAPWQPWWHCKLFKSRAYAVTGRDRSPTAH
jgi:hypothetical protein